VPATTSFAELRLADVPERLGLDWASESPTRTRFEISALTAEGKGGGLFDPPLGSVGVVLASTPRVWRDAAEAVCVERVDRQAAAAAPTESRTRVGLRRLHRAWLRLGYEGPAHSRWDEGILVDLWLAPPPTGPVSHVTPRVNDRPLRFLAVSDRPGTTGSDRAYSHLAVRAGDLANETHLDLRLTPAAAGGAPDYLGGHLDGEARRVQVLSFTSPVAGFAGLADRANWVRAALATTTSMLSLHVAPGTDTTVTAAGPLRVEASLRDRNGLRSGPLTVRAATARIDAPASISVGPRVPTVPGKGTEPVRLATAKDIADGVAVGDEGFHLSFPGPAGTTPAVGGRVAVTRMLGEAQVGDVPVEVFEPTRSNPQIRMLTRSDPGAAAVDAATVRVDGLAVLGLTQGRDGFVAVHTTLDPARPNTSLRAAVWDNTPRYALGPRPMLKARVAMVPVDVIVTSGLTIDRTGSTPRTTFNVLESRLSMRSGEGSVWFEPNLDRDALAGARAGTAAGVGLVTAAFDGLPRGLRVSTPGPDATLTDWGPGNWTPPPGWTAGGALVEISDTTTVGSGRLVTWSRDRALAGGDGPVPADQTLDPDGLISLWGDTTVSYAKIAQGNPTADGDPPRLDPISLWMLAQRPPTSPQRPDGGLGYSIGGQLLVTLDVDLSERRTAALMPHWNALGAPGAWDWVLLQEFQMENYMGTVTIASPLGTGVAGDGGAGPGKWFLRALDATGAWSWIIGWGSIYFGNTGGTFTSRPRIFR
jgi:hypothetical protein